MQSLRDKVGYVSMKIKYAEKQAQMFPSMLGLPGEKSSEQELQGLWSMEEGEHTTEEGGFTAILTPIEEKDKIILEQTTKIQLLLEKQGNMPSMQEDLEKIKTENNLLKKKLSFTRRATEQKILDNITNEEFYREDPHLVCVLSATLNEEEFEFVEDDPNIKEESPASPKLVHRSRKDKFLSSIEDKVDQNDSVTQERLSHFKNQVLDRIKSRKNRRHSISSSVGSKRRLSPAEDDHVGRTPSRPRTATPAAQS